jgi:hypothetical protein
MLWKPQALCFFLLNHRCQEVAGSRGRRKAQAGPGTAQFVLRSGAAAELCTDQCHAHMPLHYPKRCAVVELCQNHTDEYS